MTSLRNIVFQSFQGFCSLCFDIECTGDLYKIGIFKIHRVMNTIAVNHDIFQYGKAAVVVEKDDNGNVVLFYRGHFSNRRKQLLRHRIERYRVWSGAAQFCADACRKGVKNRGYATGHEESCFGDKQGNNIQTSRRGYSDRRRLLYFRELPSV